jgi:hypothetical protein
MGQVSQNPSLQEVVNVFGGPGNLRSYYRGGGYIPNVPANNAVSTDPNGLVLTQFRGAVTYQGLSASSNSIASSGSQKGTFTIGTSTCNIAGGNGNTSYSVTRVSGDTFAFTQSGNRATFTATNVQVSTTHRTAVYRWTVSDGVTSATTDFNVSWN